MELVPVVTLLTTIFSVGVKVIGMPDQIRSNYKRKSTSGLSVWFMVTTFISYVLWVVHGLEVHDNALVIGQSIGAVVTVVIVVQMYLYRDAQHSQVPKNQTRRPPLLWFTAMQTRSALRKELREHDSPGANAIE
jgi:uncharacterized protein with PQ loop repeat